MLRLQGRSGAELCLHVDLTPSKGYRLRAMRKGMGKTRRRAGVPGSGRSVGKTGRRELGGHVMHKCHAMPVREVNR